MTTIESKHVNIARPLAEVIDYAADLNNFAKLLPQDRVSDFVSDGTSCSFKIQGLSKIGLALEEKGTDTLKIKSTESPFPFTINVFVEAKDSGVEAFQKVDLDINPMMKMMVEKPLRNLFDHIASRLQEELN